MRILVMSDQKSKFLYEYFDPEQTKGIDLVISCGDLDPGYLEFFATLYHAPVIYVRGNHDSRYETRPPQGCTCIDGDLFVFRGVRILGLGGCMKYSDSHPNHYTERQMQRRIKRLRWKLFTHHGFEILVTHAAAYHLNDLPDLPHQGFKCFLELMDKYHPKLFVHGHVHANYGAGFKREDVYHGTRVVNAYEYHIVEYPEEALPRQ